VAYRTMVRKVGQPFLQQVGTEGTGLEAFRCSMGMAK
jgi:hypothetical protein